jgi:hypothetical protein
MRFCLHIKNKLINNILILLFISNGIQNKALINNYIGGNLKIAANHTFL